MQILSFWQANVEDASLLAQLGAESFYEAYKEIWNPADLEKYTKKAFAQEQIRSELTDISSTFLLAFSGSVPAGYAKLIRDQSPAQLENVRAIQIQRFYLLQAFTGQGLGYQLMESCLSVAKNEHFEAVWLAVWELNTKALAFYQRCGFEVCGTYPFNWGDQQDEDILMKLTLI